MAANTKESKWIEVFKAGSHTSSNGSKGRYTQKDVRELSDAINESLEAQHRVPVVKGHPKDNHPAYGWVSQAKSENGSLFVKLKDIVKSFKDEVDQKMYQSISVRLYPKKHPNNPTPGKLNLGHVGFFGAVQPAIKGMKAVELSDFSDSDAADGLETFLFDEQDYGDRYFSFYIFSDIAAAFSNIRDWVIEEKGIESADKLVSKYLISSLQRYGEKNGFLLPGSKTEVPMYKEENMDLQEAKQLLEAEGYAIATPEQTLKGQLANILQSFQEAQSATDSQMAIALNVSEEDFMSMKKTPMMMGSEDNMKKAAKLLGLSYADIKSMMSTRQKNMMSKDKDHSEQLVTAERFNDLMGNIAELQTQISALSAGASK